MLFFAKIANIHKLAVRPYDLAAILFFILKNG